MGFIRNSALVLCLTAFSILARAQVIVTDDANTLSTYPTKNFGNSIALVVCAGSNSYLRFSLANLGSGVAASNVSKATLVLYVDAVLTTGNVDIYEVASPWSEGSVTYSTAPSLGAKIFSSVPVTKTGFVSLDLTSTAQRWLSGALPNNGIAIVPSPGSAISASFDSKENILTSHEADLALELVAVGPPGSQGPQGVQGPPGPMGANGPMGPAGATGAQGPAGPAGPMGFTGVGLPGATGAPGPTGPAGAGFNFRNAFDSTATYVINDVVSYNGSSYVAIVANSGPNNSAPDTNAAAWIVMAAQGAAGAAGIAGAQGATGPSGPQGIQGVMGPIGLTGATGPAGPQGTAGVDGAGFNFRKGFDDTAAYAINDVVTFNGSSYIAIAANAGPNNLTPDMNLSSWNVLAVQGAAGTPGTTGPQGPQGPQGQPGTPGPAGQTGLTGAQGPSGPQGPIGPAGPQGIAGGVSLAQSKAALLQWYRKDFALQSSANAIAFDGANMWVTSALGNNNNGSVTEFRCSDGAVLGTFPTGGTYPAGIAFDGSNIWVTNKFSNSVTKLRASDGATLGTFAVGSSPMAVAFDGINIWVTNRNSNTVTKLQASDGATLGTFATGIVPQALTFDGANMWVANTNGLTKLRASDGAVLGTFAIASPLALAFDGTNIWAAGSGTAIGPPSGIVTEIHAADGAVVNTFSVQGFLGGIAFDGTNMWVVDYSFNTVLKLNPTGIIGGFPVGPGPNAIAFDGANMWVSNSDGTVSKL